MVVAVTAGGTGFEDHFETRLGQAAYFIVYDLVSDFWECHANVQNAEAVRGAGIQTAQTIGRIGVSALITGHIGPKAFKVLDANGIKIYSSTAATVREALAAYTAGQLTPMAVPDAEDKWI